MRRTLNSIGSQGGGRTDVNGTLSDQANQWGYSDQTLDYDSPDVDSDADIDSSDEIARTEQLREELESLRQSTKTALEMSWRQVERIKAENELLAAREETLRRHAEIKGLEIPSEHRQKRSSMDMSYVSGVSSLANSRKSINQEDDADVNEHEYVEYDDGVWFFNPEVKGESNEDAPKSAGKSRSVPRFRLRLGHSTKEASLQVEEQLMKELSCLEQDSKATLQHLESLLEDKMDEIHEMELANEAQNQTIESLRKQIKMIKEERISELEKRWNTTISMDQLDAFERKEFEEMTKVAYTLTIEIEQKQRQMENLQQALGSQHHLGRFLEDETHKNS